MAIGCHLFFEIEGLVESHVDFQAEFDMAVTSATVSTLSNGDFYIPRSFSWCYHGLFIHGIQVYDIRKSVIFVGDDVSS